MMNHRWRVLLTDELSGEGLALLRQQAEVVEADGLGTLPEFDALIIRSRTRVCASDLARARRLRVIGRAGVGVDNIDLAAASAAGVIIVHTPEAATVAVAEHALALMLALARRIPEADEAIRRGQWPKRDLWGSELCGKTLGIVGLGRIGAALAARAKALGMRVVAYHPRLGAEAVRGRGAEPVGFETLLEISDYVSLHLPLNSETRGFIGKVELSKMKRGARLISTARGGVVNEQALLEALEAGHLAGAALDVFAEEPPGLSAIVGHPAVISTPHIGAQTIEAQSRAAVDVASEILAALRGEPLRWRVA